MIGIKDGCYRPYIIGNNRQVKKIIFYFDGEIKLTINNGWLEDKISGYNGDVKCLDTDEPRRANKAILTKNDNFYIKSVDQSYSFESTYYDLYIYADVKFIEEYVNHTSDDESRFHYYKTFEVPISGTLGSEKKVETITVEIFSRIEEHKDLKFQNIQKKIKEKSGVDLSVEDVEKLLAVYKLEEKR